jgi:hypothetical protein
LGNNRATADKRVA